jgi:hypothetical protein
MAHAIQCGVVAFVSALTPRRAKASGDVEDVNEEQNSEDVEENIVDMMAEAMLDDDPTLDCNPGLVILRARGLVAKVSYVLFQSNLTLLALADTPLSTGKGLPEGMLPKGRYSRQGARPVL